MEFQNLIKLAENLEDQGKYSESDKIMVQLNSLIRQAQSEVPPFENGGFLGINKVNRNSITKWIVNLLATNRPNITMAIQKAWQGGDMTDLAELAKKTGFKDMAELQAFFNNHESANIIQPMLQANLNIIEEDNNRGFAIVGPNGGTYLSSTGEAIPVNAGVKFPKDVSRQNTNGWQPVLLVDGTKSWFKDS